MNYSCCSYLQRLSDLASEFEKRLQSIDHVWLFDPHPSQIHIIYIRIYTQTHNDVYITYIRFIYTIRTYTYMAVPQTSGPNHVFRCPGGQPSLWPRPWLVSSFWRQRLGFFLISQQKWDGMSPGTKNFKIRRMESFFWMAYDDIYILIVCWGKKGTFDSLLWVDVCWISRFHLWDGPFRGLEAVCATGSKIGHHKAFLACASGDSVSFAEWIPTKNSGVWEGSKTKNYNITIHYVYIYISIICIYISIIYVYVYIYVLYM